jgi:type IV secretion system protein VirB10
MSDNTPRGDHESLALRARPRRVVRFKRRMVIGIAAIACTAVLGATWIALNGPSFRPRLGDQELYNVDRKSTPDGLANLPGSYDQIKKPQLGAPLPGDLGRPVVREERNLGVPPTAPLDIRPNPEEDAARAERLRLAQQARQAKEAGVFFQLMRGERAGGAAASPSTAAGSSGAGAATPVAAADGDKLALDPDRDPNNQQRKLDFLNRKFEQGIYNPHSLQDPVSPYEVLAGTVISASLLTGLNSDLPGLVTAQVIEQVCDSVSGKTLLIPQGAKLIGSYDSVVAFGQSRVLLVWQRIVMPDGSSIQIDNLPATDTAGYAGLEDEVDYHTWSLLKGIALSTLLGVGSQMTFGSQQSNLVEAIRESTQESTNLAGQRIVQKELNIQPTLTARPGWPLRVVVHKDLVLRPYRFAQGAAP